MRISFDYDGVLVDTEFVKTCAQTHIIMGLFSNIPNIELVILTTRSEKNSPVDVIYKDKFKQIIYTNGKDKHEVIDDYKIDLHFDDDILEVVEINEKCKAKAFLVGFDFSQIEWAVFELNKLR